MGRLYLVTDKEEIDRRRKLLTEPFVVEVWQDLYAAEVPWMGDDEARRHASGTPREGSLGGLFWLGEAAKVALDSVGGPLPFLLALPDEAVPVYYGPRLADIGSLPSEESLRARVLSARGIAVVWATLHPSGARNEYQPTSPTDATFSLRRPRGTVVHLWRLFRSKEEALAYTDQHLGTDPEAIRWARRLPAEDFSALVERFGRRG